MGAPSPPDGAPPLSALGCKLSDARFLATIKANGNGRTSAEGAACPHPLLRRPQHFFSRGPAAPCSCVCRAFDRRMLPRCSMKEQALVACTSPISPIGSLFTARSLMCTNPFHALAGGMIG